MAAAEDVNAAVDWVLSNARFRTADVGGMATTRECTHEMVRAIRSQDRAGALTGG